MRLWFPPETGFVKAVPLCVFFFSLPYEQCSDTSTPADFECKHGVLRGTNLGEGSLLWRLHNPWCLLPCSFHPSSIPHLTLRVCGCKSHKSIHSCAWQARDNRHRLRHERVSLDIKRNVFPTGTVRHWDLLSREGVLSPFLEVLKPRSAKALSNLI